MKRRRIKRGHSKVHTFSITIRTDKACSRKVALREVKDCIHGEFYCTELDDGDPGEFKVVRIKR